LGFTSFNPTYTVVQMMIKAMMFIILILDDQVFVNLPNFGVGKNF
jgi:hypothetical protein